MASEPTKDVTTAPPANELVAPDPATSTISPSTKVGDPEPQNEDVKATQEVSQPAGVPIASEQVADVPDPDEDDLDDLDDLDDVLDEFAATKVTETVGSSAVPEPPSPFAASNPPPPSAISTEEAVPEDEFAQQLQQGMADLLGELDSSPEMQKQFEEMIRELGKATEGEAAGGSTAAAREVGDAASSVGGADASFQETIRKTMERMQESGDAAGQAAATSSDGDADFMAALLKEMEGGGGSDEDFSKMLMGMMEQLTNKEILYEPMKELNDKFPDWFAKNEKSTPKEDLKRYNAQRTLVKEIVAKFEEDGYTDDNATSREYILERMQKMQNEGSPPPDLVGDMESANEALGELDAGCPTQ